MLPYRQVHLDFHTSEKIPGVGARFSRDNFAQALKEGHIDSITLFAKCHHCLLYTSLLCRDGAVLLPDGRVDLARCQWDGKSRH